MSRLKDRVGILETQLDDLRRELTRHVQLTVPKPGDNALWHWLQRNELPLGEVVSAILNHLNLSIEKQREMIYLKKK